MSPYAEFLVGLLQTPEAVSAPTPSGPALAHSIAEQVDASGTGIVVELGPGTGVITRALLKHGVSPSRIVTVECCQYFVDLLKEQLPEIAVHHGDAFHFEQYLEGSAPVSAVVSAIPLLNFDPVRREALIKKALRLCGQFIQLSYGWTPPVEPSEGVILDRKVVWHNLPPAHIWHYHRVS